ncbi:hypothetical protein ElyMa_005287900 [Elysia marginata]|uniref:Uncharacterized protein n=1 Tax=Elysia marginata TaxID=1093978 RepID=A0AAV4JZY6_9GAST|nr:hypothetical protein ElyMa_005287900 [Elysia marginata]
MGKPTDLLLLDNGLSSDAEQSRTYRLESDDNATAAAAAADDDDDDEDDDDDGGGGGGGGGSNGGDHRRKKNKRKPEKVIKVLIDSVKITPCGDYEVSHDTTMEEVRQSRVIGRLGRMAVVEEATTAEDVTRHHHPAAYAWGVSSRARALTRRSKTQMFACGLSTYLLICRVTIAGIRYGGRALIT